MSFENKSTGIRKSLLPVSQRLLWGISTKNCHHQAIDMRYSIALIFCFVLSLQTGRNKVVFAFRRSLLTTLRGFVDSCHTFFSFVKELDILYASLPFSICSRRIFTFLIGVESICWVFFSGSSGRHVSRNVTARFLINVHDLL